MRSRLPVRLCLPPSCHSSMERPSQWGRIHPSCGRPKTHATLAGLGCDFAREYAWDMQRQTAQNHWALCSTREDSAKIVGPRQHGVKRVRFSLERLAQKSVIDIAFSLVKLAPFLLVYRSQRNWSTIPTGQLMSPPLFPSAHFLRRFIR